MWIANVCCVSPLFGQAVLAAEPNRPSRFLIVGSIAGLETENYAAVFERALLDRRPVLVACEQSPEITSAARNTAAARGWHFAVARQDEGFRPGLHELVIQSGRLVFRETSSTPRGRTESACSIRGGCGP